jgi:hypothetical protein
MYLLAYSFVHAFVVHQATLGNPYPKNRKLVWNLWGLGFKVYVLNYDITRISIFSNWLSWFFLL